MRAGGGGGVEVPGSAGGDMALETADKMIDKCLAQDSALPLITDKMRLSDHSRCTLSGSDDCDYPSKAAFSNVETVQELRPLTKLPLPPQILQQCGNLRTDVRMGLLPEISRAWLAVDTNLYLWNYDTGNDVAYYDGLSEAIVSVGLVKPRSGVFQDFIQHLLIITTPSEILALGVTLVKAVDNRYGDELQLTAEVVYSVGTEGVAVTRVLGSHLGRIFLGGADGCLYELKYQKEVGWWGKRCEKVNHSKGLLSWLVPGVLSSALAEEDNVVMMVEDRRRHLLYTLTERGTVEVFDLGPDGRGMSRVASLTHSALLYTVSNLLRCENVDSNSVELGRVVSICPCEDLTIVGLIAVTQYGVRYYLSTCNSPRPTNLHLIHLRLPPGYTPVSSLSLRGSSVLQAVSLKGSVVMTVGSLEGSEDRIWCLSGDLFSSRTWFSESATHLPLTSRPVALEVTTQRNEFGTSAPLMTCQHNRQPDRLVLLTLQGTEVYEKLRPVDVVAEVLRGRSGPDSQQLRHLFNLVTGDEACAMCVMLASDHSTTNTQVGEWAMRGLMVYGGEAKAVSQIGGAGGGLPHDPWPVYPPPPPAPTTGPASASTLPSCFRPRDVSTPLGNRVVSGVSAESPAGVETSHKHNGLYLYLARILAPLWTRPLVTKVTLSHSSPTYVASSLVESDVSRVVSQLYALQLFLQKNTQLPPSSSVPQSVPEMGGWGTHAGIALGSHVNSPLPTHAASPLTARSRTQEAHVQERNSLDSLKHMVNHSLQVLSLWKLLLQHEFHLIVMTLPEEVQKQLTEMRVRDLIVNGSQICHALVNALVTMYLKDNSSVDSISSKLREVCPSLFKPEDAACSKANEVLMAVKEESDPEERQAKLRTALKLCKEVAGEVDMRSVCAQLVQCQYYEGVIELCVERANKLDPHCLATHHLTRDHPPDDPAITHAYLTRVRVYQEVGVMLDQLYQQCQPQPPTSPASSQPQPYALVERVVEEVLEKGDEVCHCVVYDWLVGRGLTGCLVRLGRGRASLERYLTRQPNSRLYRDLLWQYYQTTGNHSAAARVLYSLATLHPCEGMKLDDRLSYLGKAVMCMRSDGCGSHLGMFLHELEDTLQVARLQKQVMDQMSGLSSRDGRVEEALQKLNSGLLTLTQVYENFAVAFELWDSQLAVLECAGLDDRLLVERTWQRIIAQEVSRGSGSSPDDQMALLMNKVRSLGLQLSPHSSCFPIGYLVRELEVVSCRLNVNKAHVHSGMTAVGVSVQQLLDIYHRLYSLNDRVWMVEGNEFHLIQVIASFADAFTNNLRIVPAEERKSVGLQFQDLIVNCLNTLYCKQDVGQLIAYLKTVQTNLDKV